MYCVLVVMFCFVVAVLFFFFCKLRNKCECATAFAVFILLLVGVIAIHLQQRKNDDFERELVVLQAAARDAENRKAQLCDLEHLLTVSQEAIAALQAQTDDQVQAFTDLESKYERLSTAQVQNVADVLALSDRFESSGK